MACPAAGFFQGKALQDAVYEIRGHAVAGTGRVERFHRQGRDPAGCIAVAIVRAPGSTFDHGTGNAPGQIDFGGIFRRGGPGHAQSVFLAGKKIIKIWKEVQMLNE